MNKFKAGKQLSQRLFSSQQNKNTKQNNPFVRAQLNRQQQEQQPENQKNKFIERKKTIEEIKIEFSRRITLIKIKTIPFLKTLDFGFFARVAIFGGIVYFLAFGMSHSKDLKVSVQEEGSNSPNKYSKTFGQEKRLDKILEQLREEDQAANQDQK